MPKAMTEELYMMQIAWTMPAVSVLRYACLLWQHLITATS
jgi:hypothetical protein